MREENKGFFKQSVFIDRVQCAMARRDMDYDQLCDVLNNKVKYSIAKGNLRMYIAQRSPNVNFLFALSEALAVSTDFLLGKSNDGLQEGINQRIHSQRYQKYKGKYYIYFYETVDNEMREIEPGTLEIEFAAKYKVTMVIKTKEGGEKKYTGDLQISETSPNVFIILHSSFGEVVSMAFYDENMNLKTFECTVGGMLSISSGDLKRAPVMNRFIITAYKVSDEKKKFIYAHLKMNTKYINITEVKLYKSVREVLADSEQTEKTELIIQRLKNAFCKKEYYAIEESFITNTIRKDFELSEKAADELVAIMRNNSLANINSKINKSLDSVVFKNTTPEDDVKQ